jgi:hypothetical protein
LGSLSKQRSSGEAEKGAAKTAHDKQRKKSRSFVRLSASPPSADGGYENPGYDLLFCCLFSRSLRR